MFKILLLFGTILSAFCAKFPLERDSWALLVAGSRGWNNYRHQADVCHSYHVMRNEGIPEDRIIVMMYDDIAYNSNNPYQGVIMNSPNGTNVYAGVKIDYKGNDVNPKNFLNVLTGNKRSMRRIGSGRVIESQPKHNVFVYFADHGGTGLLAFYDEYLYADQLMQTFKMMYDRRKYKQLIMYVEACESGSMFSGLLSENHNIIAMTAAARDESSYGTYCSNSMNICLGDLFSVSWMQQMDKMRKGSKESIFSQYQTVREMVSSSHVELYGDFHVGFDELTPNKKEILYMNALSKNGTNDFGEQVDSREIPLFMIKSKIHSSRNHAKREQYEKELDSMKKARSISDVIMQRLVAFATGRGNKLFDQIISQRFPIKLENFPCYRRLVSAFEKQCFDAKNDYFLRHFYKFANLCVLGVDTTKLLGAMGHVCTPLKKHITVAEVN